MELQKMYVTLAMNSDAFRAGIADAQKAAEGFQSRISGAIGKAGKVITGAFAGVGVAAVAGFGMAMKSAIDMNASLEQSTMQFTTLMGDADMAAEHVAMLFELGAKTPFETEPIIAASKHLQVFGGAALNTQDNLIMIGDAAAAVGQNFDEVAFWTGRAYSAIQGGQPFGEAAMRLQEMGLMTPEVRSQMEKLQESGADASEVWGAFSDQLGTFTGAMEMQAGSWAGITSTLSDTLQMLAANALKPFFDLAKQGVQGFSDLLNSPAVQAGITALAEKLTAVIQAISDFIGGIASGEDPVGDFANLAWALANAFGATQEQAALVFAKVRELGDKIAAFVGPIAEAVTQFVSWKDVLAGLAILVASVVIPVIAGIIVAVAPIALTIGGIIAVVALFRNAWENNWGGIQEKVAAVIAFVVPLIQNGIAAIKMWWDTNGAAILAKAQEIFTGIQTVIQTVIGGVILWWNTNWPTIQATIQTVWGIVQTVIQTAIDIIRPAIETLIENGRNAMSGLGELVGPLQELWASIGPAVQTAATIIGTILTTLLGLIVGIVSGIAQAIRPLIDTFIDVAKAIIGIVTGIVETVTGFFQLLIGLVTGNTEMIEAAWEKMKNGVEKIVTNLVDGVVNLITGLWETLKALVGGIVDGVVEFFTTLWDKLVGNSIVVDIVNDIVTWFETLLEWISDVLTNLWDTVSRPFINMWTQLVQWWAGKVNEALSMGRNLVQGIINGINAVGMNILAVLGDWVQAAITYVKNLLGISSPAKALVPVGIAIADGIIAGIKSKDEDLYKTLENLFDVAGKFGNLASGFGQAFGRQVIDPIAENIHALGEQVDAMEKQADIAGDAAASFGGRFTELVESMGLGAFVDDPNIRYILQLNLSSESAWVRSQAMAAINMLDARNSALAEQGNLQHAITGVNAEIIAQQEEMARQQERLAAIEEKRADIAFLQQQFDLLQLIKDNKLDSNLLDGIALGLEADAGALMDAMVAAMQQMIQAAEDELGIASPSKWARGLMENVFETMADTAAYEARLLETGMESALSSTLDIWDVPRGGSSTDNRRTNYGGYHVHVNTTENEPLEYLWEISR